MVDHDPREVLLVTATIRPNTGRVVAVTDPTVRARQYESALARWLATLDPARDRVVVAESSGADTAGLVALGRAWSPQAFSLLELPGCTPTLRGGKGSGEAAMVEAVVAELCRQGLDPTTPVTKCTGRLYVANHRDYGPMSGDVRAALRSDLVFADSRYWTLRLGLAAQHLTGIAAEVDELAGIDVEHVFARRVLQALGAGARWERWPELPRIVGVSGSTGSDYAGRRARARLAIHERVRAAARRRPFTL